MKRRYFYLFTAALVLLAVSCVQYGTLNVILTASESTINAGGTIEFNIELPAGHQFDPSGQSYAKILDSDGATVKHINLSQTTFQYQFNIADNYQVEVAVQSKKNFGYASTDICVEYDAAWLSSFSLADSGNQTSIMGNDGEVLPLDFSYLVNYNSVKSIDVRIKDQKGKVIFFQKEVPLGKCSYTHISSNGYGTMTVFLTVAFNDGNKATVSDQFVILDPNNPVKILLTASKNDINYPNTIAVTGRAEISGMAGDFVQLYIERSCYYGKENGIHVLSEPNGDPNNPNDTTFYSKVGQDYVKHTERYYAIRKATDSDPDDIKTEHGSVIVTDSPFVYSIEDKDFTFIDPMPYYNENGNIEKTGFKWSYAMFDREAWKAIKRKKAFDLEQALSVEYVVYAQAVIGGVEKDLVASTVKKGIPYLETASMAQFCMWLKDCAMNRLWHMQVPRYCYDKSMTLMKSTQNENGLVSGNVYYNVHGTSSGSGALKNYSDWAGVRLYTNNDINISLPGLFDGASVRRSLSASLSIVTSIWPNIRFDIADIAVRDFILQWGLWDDGKGANLGSLKLNRGNGVEVVGYDELLDIMPRYKHQWHSYPGYGYEPYDWKGFEEQFRLRTDEYGTGYGEGGASWTHINFKYNPIAGEPAKYGIWHSKESEWRVDYAILK